MRLVAALLTLAASQSVALRGADFDLPASPTTVAWGYYSANVKPALTVHSGDTVRVHTLSTCSIERMEAGGVPPNTIPQFDRDIHEQVKEKGPGGHILTGPIEIAEAEPGDVLEVQIQKIDIDVPYACNSFGPGRGFLPNDFPYQRTKVIPLDREHMLAKICAGHQHPSPSVFRQHGRRALGRQVE